MKIKHDGIEAKMVGDGVNRLTEYVRKGLICKSLEDKTNFNSEILQSEVTIKNNKWAIFSAYRLPCNQKLKLF